jgi:hypothetical protein
MDYARSSSAPYASFFLERAKCQLNDHPIVQHVKLLEIINQVDISQSLVNLMLSGLTIGVNNPKGLLND